MGLPAFTHPYIATGVTILVFVVLQVRRSVPTDLVFMFGVMVVTLCGVITPDEALSGFANPAPLTVAGLLAVAAGLRTTGVLDWVGRTLLGRVDTERKAMARLSGTLVAASAFMLNTAVVAMMMPVVIDWCRRRNVSPSRLLIPLSYWTILGGVCTLVGTSTTLVANGVLREQYRQRSVALESVESQTDDSRTLAWKTQFRDSVHPMGLFELGAVGLPCALVGGTLLIYLAPRLLPNRTDIVEQLGEQRREYLVEMLVRSDCPLIGKPVEEAGLRRLPGLFLIEIDRNGDIITPVTPQDTLRAHDRLLFTGVVSTIVDLEKIPGLVPAGDLSYEFHPAKRMQRRLTEVVLSPESPLIGSTVREGNFRQKYNAAVVAVHRSGERLTRKIGDIALATGDTLLLQTRNDFVSNYRNSRDFYLVSDVETSTPRLHHKMKLAAGLALLLIALLCFSTWISRNPAWTTICAATVVILMVLTRCVTMNDVRNSFDVRLILTIVGALGLGRALQTSGAAESIADSIVNLCNFHPLLLLAAIYVTAVIFTETITNNAVAALLLPIAIAVAWEGHYNPRPFIIAITLAASLSFVTPIGYQTNLMVMGPGGYRPVDFLKCGIPLAIAVGCTALLLIPQIWPLTAN